MAIRVHLDDVLRARNMTSKELCAKVGITEANLSILRSGKAKGVRFNTDEIIVDHGWGTHGARYILFPGPDGETIEVAEEMK